MKVTIKISAYDINKMYIKQKYAKKKTLSEDKRNLIRSMHNLGYSYRKIANMLDVSVMTVFMIINQDKYTIYKCKMKKRNKEQYDSDPEYRKTKKERQKRLYKKKQRFYTENKLTKIKGE